MLVCVLCVDVLLWYVCLPAEPAAATDAAATAVSDVVAEVKIDTDETVDLDHVGSGLLRHDVSSGLATGGNDVSAQASHEENLVVMEKLELDKFKKDKKHKKASAVRGPRGSRVVEPSLDASMGLFPAVWGASWCPRCHVFLSACPGMSRCFTLVHLIPRPSCVCCLLDAALRTWRSQDYKVVFHFEAIPSPPSAPPTPAPPSNPSDGVDAAATQTPQDTQDDVVASEQDGLSAL